MKVNFRGLILVFIICLTIIGCVENNDVETKSQTSFIPTVYETQSVEPIINKPEPASAEGPGLEIPLEPSKIRMGVPESIQELLGDSIELGEGFDVVDDLENASLVLSVMPAKSTEPIAFRWVFALVAPFPTVTDEITTTDLVRMWRGMAQEDFLPEYLLVSRATFHVFNQLWGSPHQERVRIVERSEMLDLAWEERKAWGILPFEEISPRWKVVRIDGVSPFDQDFDPLVYELSVNLGWKPTAVDSRAATFQVPLEAVVTNRDEEKFTSLILTGTTALVRHTALRMEEKGIAYPASDIQEWLVSADLTHISNEAPFYPECPPAIPLRGGRRFCSDPRYIELLKAVGADVIELTGNHLLDWGMDPFLYTLDLYVANNMHIYGGGRNLDEAIQPLIIEHHRNRIAFLGCNRAGPENIWAGENLPGTAPCDLNWMEEEIRRLRAKGYLPVVTFQHYEVEDFTPMNLTKQEFRRMSAAGAVIVSGSQAHFPHGFEFIDDGFMHFGLGNLFFDQMFYYHRRQFIDRHIFYNGKYLGVEILTTMLEDNARPRPMTVEERQDMLADYFLASGW